MSSKLALTIGAVAAFLFGLAPALVPDPMRGGFGLATPKEALVVSRDTGVTSTPARPKRWPAGRTCPGCSSETTTPEAPARAVRPGRGR